MRTSWSCAYPIVPRHRSPYKSSAFFRRRSIRMTQTNAAVGGHFKWLGIVLIVLGMAAIVTPAAAGSAVVVVIGIILLGAGVAAAIRGLQGDTAMEKVLG